jgi:hypothetical protein
VIIVIIVVVIIIIIIIITACCKENKHAVGVMYSYRTLAADSLQRVRRESSLTKHGEK